MRIIITILFLSVFISGCSILPGMQNLNTVNVPQQKTAGNLKVEPVLVPINANLLANNPPVPYIYHVSPQDVLSIVVWRHPEFTAPSETVSLNPTLSSQGAGQSGYLVNFNGDIYFPLVGYVPVSGKTINEVHDLLTQRLKKYVRNPQVMVRVADYRSKRIYVLGEILKPTLLPLNDQPMSITDALTLAGSMDQKAADTRHVYVIRGYFARPTIYWLNANTPDTLLLAQNFQLQPGDVIYVSTATMTRWNRFLDQLLPTITSIFYTQSVVRNS